MTRTEAPAFTSRVAPGAVWVEGRCVDYALGPWCGDCVTIWIVDVFAPGDERARLVFPLPDGATVEQTRDHVDAIVFSQVAAAVRKCHPNEVDVPERIGSWPLGMTEADVAAHNARMRELRAQPPASKVASLEGHRRARRVS